MFKKLFLTAQGSLTDDPSLNTDTPLTPPADTSEELTAAEQFVESIKNFFTNEGMIEFIIRVLIGLVVIIVGCFLIKKFTQSIEKGKLFKKVNKTLRTYLKHILGVVFYVVLFVGAVAIMGFEIAAISAAISSVGLALGLALQGGLSNIAGGVMLVIFKPFEVGDYIEGAGISGTVVDIGLFYTTVTTPDNKKVVVPNGTISNSDITNYSAHETRRLDLDFDIAYTADINTAKKILYACAKADERVLKDPSPAVMISAMSDSSVKIKLRVWVKKDDYWDVNFSMLEQVKLNFDQFGIEIPFPQLDVHIANKK